MEVCVFFVSCQFMSYEDNFVLIFTKVYGPFLRGQREDFWEELTDIRGFWTDPWCVHEGVNMLRF